MELLVVDGELLVNHSLLMGSYQLLVMGSYQLLVDSLVVDWGVISYWWNRWLLMGSYQLLVESLVIGGELSVIGGIIGYWWGVISYWWNRWMDTCEYCNISMIMFGEVGNCIYYC